MATKYTIEASNQGTTDYIPLAATTDAAAITETQRYAATSKDEQIYLAWHRESDGCKGYINADGNASPTGKSWR